VVGFLIKFGPVVGCSLFMLVPYSHGADRRQRFQQSLLVNRPCISFQIFQPIYRVREIDPTKTFLPAKHHDFYFQAPR